MALAVETTQAKHSGKPAILAVPMAQTGIPVQKGWSQLKQLAQQAGKHVQLKTKSKHSAQLYGLWAKSLTPLRRAHRPDPEWENWKNIQVEILWLNT